MIRAAPEPPRRVLVVEATAAMARSLTRQLARLGYEVVGVASSGARALELAAAAQADVALVDLHLDGALDGLATAAELRARHGLPIAFVTARDDDDAALAAGGDAGALGCVVKSFHRRELRTAIAIAMYKHAADRERQRLEEQVRHAAELETLGRFAAGIAHDFNNLLETIMGTAGSLVAQLAPCSAPRRQATLIEAAAERAARLTARLLEFASHDTTPPAPLDVGEQITALAPLLAEQLGADIALETEVAPGLPAVCVHRAELEQVLLNLVANARDAMPGGGRLAITAAHDPSAGGLVLTVADTGHGMDEAVAARAFEPLFTTKARGQGFGLGLATVHAAVARARGCISVASRPGEGTTFTLRFPAGAPGEAPRCAAASMTSTS